MSKISESDIQSIESKVRSEYKDIDLKVQEQLPQYKTSLQVCQTLIDAYETCLTKGSMFGLNSKSAFSTPICIREEKAMRECTQQASCPQEFSKYTTCLANLSNPTKDRYKCRQFYLELEACSDDLADKVHLATKKAFRELRN